MKGNNVLWIFGVFFGYFFKCACDHAGLDYLIEDDYENGGVVLEDLYLSTEETDPHSSYGGEKYQGDIVEDPFLRGAVRDADLLWPDGIVPYAIDLKYNGTQRAKIAAAIMDFHSQTCIQFIPRGNKTVYLDIVKGFDCSSLVGYQNKTTELSLADDCLVHGVIIHELFHALGFWHEQSRTDRDDFVTVVFENIPSRFRSQFAKYSQNKIQHLGESYDYGSVMHYEKDAFSVNGRDTIIPKQPTAIIMGQRIGFSETDVHKVNKLYKCATNERWKEWTLWTSCSVTCGSGLKSRTRPCSKNNECLGLAAQRVFCSELPCPAGSGSTAQLVLVIGGLGLGDSGESDTMELFDPEDRIPNKVLTTRLEAGRYGHVSGVLSSGVLIIAGGVSDNWQDWTSVEIYDPTSGSITSGQPMNTNKRFTAGGAVLNNAFYVCGGFTSSGNVNTCERYVDGFWEYTSSMSEKRAAFSLIAAAGVLYAIGGETDSVERFSPTDNRWAFVAPMRLARKWNAASVLDGSIYVCGGVETPRDCERYDVGTNTWQLISSTNDGRDAFALVTLENKLYAIGRLFAESSAERYDAANDSWTVLPASLRINRWGHSAVLV